MIEALREVSDHIIEEAIKAVLPDAAVKRALEGKAFSGKVVLVAVGKSGLADGKGSGGMSGETGLTGALL